MTRPEAAHLLVEADLQVDVDGVQAWVTGHGDHLVVTTDHPVRLLRAAAPLARIAGSHRSRSALDRLSAEGLTVTVASRRGELVHLGATAGSRGVRVALPQAMRGVLAASTAVAAASVVVRLVRRTRQPE